MTVLIQQGINITDLIGSFVPPVVIDLDGDGVEFTGLDAGFTFDVTGDGVVDRTAFAGPDDGILIFDGDRNGTISGPQEFVFTSFIDGARTDLEGLAFFDTDGDQLLDADDEGFADFAVFQDENFNGVVDAGEFNSLAELGIESISLSSDGAMSVAANGDVVVEGLAEVSFSDGSTTQAADAAFRFVDAQSETTDEQPAGLLEIETLTLDLDQITTSDIGEQSSVQPTGREIRLEDLLESQPAELSFFLDPPNSGDAASEPAEASAANTSPRIGAEISFVSSTFSEVLLLDYNFNDVV